MAKHLNISLGVTADTSKAKAQLQDLQNQLTKIINSPTSNRMDLAKEIREASQAAAELQAHLKNATNVDTGTLDFTKLSNSLKQSGQTLESYAQKLVRVGPEGRQAFQQLTTSVAQSEIPIKRVNKQLTEMWTTLKNSARWQISSSILHGFMGAVSSAYGYAQDLNESLTNIRIVTGQNTDQMAKFAKQANEAAKALSTTTTRYTNASLIYYQQGLSDEEVKKRTDITVKMANAAGASAETVSDQLTAVWNNFYDGTKSLEHYADVMTALGAATASSTDEIAGGLEKFAAVADTIGLSYEYAASALATITSNTRQSEEVVGTALKTIFARIQGLNLGETLEDGTSLNKYSEALAKVGIDIFEVNGEIKKMDNILNELGAKWQQLGKDQQIALAQTVAGVRQYNQLVSFMDNWDNGDNDSFQANLNTAQNSKGALQEQADIYAEGWEAASDRVRASMEGIYETIIDDDMFIGILDGLAEIVQYTDRLIDGMGGLGGVISTVGAIGTKVFSKQIAQQMRDTAYGISMMTTNGRKQYYDNKQKQVDKLTGMASNMRGKSSSTADQAWATGVENSAKLRTILEQNSANMTAEQITTAQARIEAAERTAKEVEEKARKFDEAKSSNRNIKEQVRQIGIENANVSSDSGKTGIAAGLEQQKKYNELEKKYTDYYKQFRNIDKMVTDQAMVDKKTVKEMYSLADKLGIKHLDTDIELFTNDDQKEITEAVISDFNALGDKLKNVILNSIQNELGIIDDDLTNKIKDSIQTQGNLASDVEQAQDVQRKEQEENEKFIREQGQEGRVYDWADKATAVADAALSLTSAMQALGGIKDVLSDDTLSGWEKFSSIVSVVAMNVPMLLSSFTQLSTVFGGTAGAIKGLNAATAFLNPSLAATGVASGAAATGIGGLASAFGSLMIAAAPWLAIAALVVGSIVAIDKAHVSEKEAADEAAKSAKKLAEEYDNINNAYQDLKNTLSNYQEAKDGIAELTKGTQEYKEAVLAANEQALDLIAANKELVGSYSTNDQGLIEIDPNALKELQDKKLESMINAQNMKILSSQESNEAQLNLKRSNLSSAASNENVLSAIANSFNNLDDSRNKAMFASDEAFKEAVEKLFPNFDDLSIELLVDEREIIEQLINELNANTESQKASNSLMIQNSFGEEIDNTNLSSGKQELLSTILSSNLNTKKEELTQKYLNYDGTQYEEVLDQAEAFGEAYGYKIKKGPATATSDVIYEDSEGKEKTFTRAEIASFAALQEATNELSNSFEENVKLITEQTKNLNDAQTEALSTFANGEIGDLSKLTAKEIKELQTVFESDLGKALSIDPNTFETAYNNLNDAIENFKNNLTTSVREKFETINTNGMSLAVQQRIGDVLNKAFHEGGYESLDAATKIFSQLRGNVDEFFTVVDSMDWTTGTVTAEEFNQKLRDANIILPNASSALQDFVHWINEVKGAASSASNVDYYNTMSEIQSAGFKLDGSLSDEQYNVLLNHPDTKYQELAKNFVFQPDGTWAFSGDSADIKNANDIFLKDYQSRFMAGAEEATNKIQTIEEIQGYDFEELTNGKRGSADLLTDRINALDTLAYDSMSEEDKKKFDEYKAKIDDGVYDRTQADVIAQLTEKYKDNFTTESLEAAKSSESLELSKNVQAMFGTVQDKEALDELYETYKNVEGAAEAYNQAVRRLENTRLTDELGVTQEELDEVAEGYYKSAKAAGMNDEVATKTAYNEAESHFKRIQAIEELSSKWKDYANTINDIGTPDENIGDNTQRINDLKQALEDITGIDANLFTDKWLQENQANLKKLASGSEEVLKEIREEFQDAQSLQAMIDIGIELNDGKMGEAEQQIHNAITAIADANILTLNADLDNTGLLQALNESFQAAGWTATQIEAYMQKMGFNAKLNITRKQLRFKQPGVGVDTIINDDGSQISMTAADGVGEEVGYIDVPAVEIITQSGSSGGGFTTNTSKEAADAVSGGGSSDEPTQMEYTKEIDFYERYKEWDDALDDIDDVLSDVQKKEDALYGQNKIAAMKNRNKLLLKEVEALQQKKKEAEAYFEIDKQNLQNAAGALGYEITFGSRDQILNYTSTMQSLFDELHAMEVHFNSLGSGKAQQAYKKNVLDPFNQKVDDLKQYIDQYDETRELIEDLENDIDDSLYEWKGLNYEILHYEMEIKIEINDLALTRLDYYLEKLEGDFYSVSEAAAYLTSRFEPVLNKLAAYEELYRDTTKMWDSTTQLYGDIMEGIDETIHQSNEERLDAMSGGLVGAFTGNGVIENNPTDFYTQTADGKLIAVGEEGYINALDRDITQADYVEGLYESFEGIFEELGELVDMDKQMMEFYANAIEMAREELEFYTDSLGHLTNALKHYHKVADITGKTNDYGFMGKMLEAQAATIENELSVASSNYEMWKQQKAYWEAQLATAEEGTKQWEFYKENLDAAVKATEEAQEEMLQKTEEWAEALRAILEHELQDAARILENALTGGTSFDTMNKALERAESLQEEYLTTTNKIYETTKLMRQAQQEIDKTTNNSSKLRLNMFITETEQLQQQNRLSEYELSIQQAKYQLLLAELALEEAKNSKSTVRLQRDFEGNFGYVYTADQDQIDSALQNLDDKRNELYNIGLEGANNYTSKYLSTLSAMYDEFTTIQQNYLNGMYESEEEYQNALLDAYDYYYEQLKNYEELYGIAIRTDSRVTADAWSTDFQDMIYSTEIWADECDVYITQVTELFEEWGETSEDLNQILDDTTGTIDEIVRASDELAASINDHVVPGLQQELDLLNEILRAYGLIRDKVFEDINHYEDTADEIYDDIVEEAERDDYEDEEFEQESPEPANKTNKPTSSSSSGEKGNPETGANDIPDNLIYGSKTYTWTDSSGKTTSTTITVSGTSTKEVEDALRESANNIKPADTVKTFGSKTQYYDTGGYTGAWGPEGKLAVLHEKEIVLNKSDTENILQAVDMVRQISTGIDQQASYQRIATLITQTLQEKKDNDVLEQHVTIEARFDNVRDRYEIEAAFDNLINKASQYANRNKI